MINSNLCDSLLNINLNLQKSNAFNIAIASCDSIVVNGQIYRQSGSYMQILKNSNQCDSILTINFNHLISKKMLFMKKGLFYFPMLPAIKNTVQLFFCSSLRLFLLEYLGAKLILPSFTDRRRISSCRLVLLHFRLNANPKFYRIHL